jgi:hypothetical protein
MASPKPKRKPKPKKDASKKPQSERFMETARELGAMSRIAFERSLGMILPSKRRDKKG